VTVAGHAAAISAGEWVTASGARVNDRTHGRQFKARFVRTLAPASLDGIEKYVSFGMIRGIGYAKMVKAISFVHKGGQVALDLALPNAFSPSPSTGLAFSSVRSAMFR